MPKTLLGTNLKQVIMDILTLLVKLNGREEILEFIEHHFFLVQEIGVEDMKTNCAQIIYHELASWLNSARGFKKFYMSSYLIYALSSDHLWNGLQIIPNYDECTKVYELYPHLQL